MHFAALLDIIAIHRNTNPENAQRCYIYSRLYGHILEAVSDKDCSGKMSSFPKLFLCGLEGRLALFVVINVKQGALRSTPSSGSGLVRE